MTDDATGSWETLVTFVTGHAGLPQLRWVIWHSSAVHSIADSNRFRVCRRQYGGFGPVVVARRQAPRVISVLPVIRPEPRPITGPLRIADNPSGLGKSDANLAQRQPRPQVGSSENSAVAAFAIGAVESHRVTRTHFFRRRVPL
jgi:hypothetical protein